jgi:hypothetical protein
MVPPRRNNALPTFGETSGDQHPRALTTERIWNFRIRSAIAFRMFRRTAASFLGDFDWPPLRDISCCVIWHLRDVSGFMECVKREFQSPALFLAGRRL